MPAASYNTAGLFHGCKATHMTWGHTDISSYRGPLPTLETDRKQWHRRSASGRRHAGHETLKNWWEALSLFPRDSIQVASSAYFIKTDKQVAFKTHVQAAEKKVKKMRSCLYRKGCTCLSDVKIAGQHWQRKPAVYTKLCSILQEFSSPDRGSVNVLINVKEYRGEHFCAAAQRLVVVHYMKVTDDKSISKNTIEKWAFRLVGLFKQTTLNEWSF